MVVELKLSDLKKEFPHKYSQMTPNQERSFEIITKNLCPTLELPTGTGKTDIGVTWLKALQKKLGNGLYFYIVPNKTLVDQVKRMYQDDPCVKIMYGRNEYQCLYYTDENVTAEEAPCSMLDCGHRVSASGEVQDKDTCPCPYLQAKHEARKGGIIVATMSFYACVRKFGRWEEPKALVIDEVHKLANVIRKTFSYEITCYHLTRAIMLLQDIIPREANKLARFAAKMVQIIREKPTNEQVLLEYPEIEELMKLLEEVDDDAIKAAAKGLARETRSCRQGQSEQAKEQREVLKRLESLTRNLKRYYKSLIYSLPAFRKEAKPLNYIYGVGKKKKNSNERSKYRLFVKSYYVVPTLTGRHGILPELTLSYSATIGDPDILKFKTGIDKPFFSLPSDFPVENAKIFLPTDTPNLAVKERNKREPAAVLRKIAKACRRLADSGKRSLVIVVSNAEKEKFLKLCEEEKVLVVSYGNGVKPREAAERFKRGEGEVLVGTIANYGEGVDLPKGIAPVIFFLRPGYPNPKDPTAIFEERRFRGMRWRLWNWRVMMELLQVRGRNIRSAHDIGTTILISQQFRRFVVGALPEWLREAYKGDLKFKECLELV